MHNPTGIAIWIGGSYNCLVALTVEQLTRIPHLGTRLHAGGSGLQREILWAHVCELPDPSGWMSGGELVMTTGLGLPVASAEQVRYVERLAGAGVSALAIGEDMSAPALSDAMLDAAERLGLPVLITSYEVPFIALARAVAEQVDKEERERMVRTLELYEAVRAAATEGEARDELVRRLESITRCRLWAVDAGQTRMLLLGAPAPAEEALAALDRELEAHSDRRPAVLRLGATDDASLALPIPGSHAAILLASPTGAGRPSLPLLGHAAALLGIELERGAREREHERTVGGELLAHLVDSRLTHTAGEEALATRGLATEGHVLVALAGDPGPIEDDDLHHRLAWHRVPHLLLSRTGMLLGLLPDRQDTLAVLADELETGARVGVSGAIGNAARVPEAAREARLALEAGRREGLDVVRYEDARATSPFVPRTVAEAQDAVDHVLGPLVTYDAEHGTELVRTLQLFLATNRSWRQTAEELFIHRQTLVYRVRRIEELTSRSLRDTGNVAEFWLALRCLVTLEL
jgi:purine catabolism regulator